LVLQVLFSQVESKGFDKSKAQKMKRLLWTFALFLLSAYFVDPKESQSATAIKGIVEGFFINRSIPFDFIIYRSPLLTKVEEIMKTVKIVTKIVNIETTPEYVFINQSAVLFFNDFETYKEFSKIATPTNIFPTEFYFFVYIEKLSRNEPLYFVLQNPFQPYRLFIFTYYLLNLEEKKYIELITFSRFQQPKCEKQLMLSINRFDKKKKKWEERKFAIKKYRNFNNCEMVFMTSYSTPIYIPAIHDIVKAKLNINSKSLTFEKGKPKPRFDFSLISMTFRLFDNINRIAKNISTEIKPQFVMTQRITTEDIFFVISRSAPLSIAQKALLPFDDEVWHWLIGSLTVGVVVILAVSVMKQNIRNFVIGSRIKSPIVNMM
jgi:hypothetical protein